MDPLNNDGVHVKTWWSYASRSLSSATPPVLNTEWTRAAEDYRFTDYRDILTPTNLWRWGLGPRPTGTDDLIPSVEYLPEEPVLRSLVAEAAGGAIEVAPTKGKAKSSEVGAEEKKALEEEEEGALKPRVSKKARGLEIAQSVTPLQQIPADPLQEFVIKVPGKKKRTLTKKGDPSFKRAKISSSADTSEQGEKTIPAVTPALPLLPLAAAPEEKADLVEEDFGDISDSLPPAFTELLVGETGKGGEEQMKGIPVVDLDRTELVDVHLRVSPVRAMSPLGEPPLGQHPKEEGASKAEGSMGVKTDVTKVGEGVSSLGQFSIKNPGAMARGEPSPHIFSDSSFLKHGLTPPSRLNTAIEDLQKAGPSELNKRFYQLLNELIPLWGATADLATKGQSLELELQVLKNHQDSRALELAEAKSALEVAKADNKALVDRVTQAVGMEASIAKAHRETLIRKKVLESSLSRLEEENKALKEEALKKQEEIARQQVALEEGTTRSKSLESDLVASQQLAELEREARVSADEQTRTLTLELTQVREELNASKQSCEILKGSVSELEGEVALLKSSLPQVKSQGVKDFLAMEGPSQKVSEAFISGFYKCKTLALADPSQLPSLEVPTVNTLGPEVLAKVEELKPDVVSLLQYFRVEEPDLLATWEPPSSEMEEIEEEDVGGAAD